MDLEFKMKHFKAIYDRYHKASRRLKKIMLDNSQAVSITTLNK